MAFNAIKIIKLYYFAKTLDSLSYRKIRLKLGKGFWVVWYMKRGRWWWWGREGGAGGRGEEVGVNIPSGLRGEYEVFCRF